MPQRHPKRVGHAFEVADPTRLEIEPEEIAASIESGGIGHPVVHYLRCRRFVVELAVMLDLYGADPAGDVRRAYALLAVYLSGAPARGALPALADSLRISRDEPFVYGRAMPLSENDSLSLRAWPTRSDARLMVVYQFDL